VLTHALQNYCSALTQKKIKFSTAPLLWQQKE